MWFLVALFVVSMAASLLLTPKTKVENARASSLDDLNFPRADEGAPVPLILGRVLMRGPNTGWVGDFEAVPIKKKQKTGLFSSKKVIVGYTYYLGFQLILSLGKVTLHKIICDKNDLWSGTASADGQVLNINLPNLFGGKEKGGGFIATARYYSGSITQAINAYLESKIGAGDVPGYRGFSHLVFEKANIGESNQLRSMQFELSQYTNGLALAGGIERIGDDMNPMELLYQAFTLDWGGLDVSPGLLDLDSLKACAQTLYSEGNGMSVCISSPNPGKEIANEVLRQVDGLMYQDPQTGKMVMKLIRNDYNIEDLPVFDESNIITIRSFTSKLWEDTINQVRVKYTNREKNYETGTTMVQDMANINAQGRVRSITQSYPGIMLGTLGTEVATRDLTQGSVPLMSASIEMNRQGAKLRPGDPFLWAWDAFGLERVVMRVKNFDLGALNDNRIAVECNQDDFAIDLTVFAPPTSEGSTIPPRNPADITGFLIRELPYFLDHQAALGSREGYSRYFAFALKPTSYSVGYSALTVDPVSGEQITALDVNPYPTTARLNAGVDEWDGFVAGKLSSMVIKNVIGDVPANTTLTNMRQGYNLFSMNNEIFGFLTRTDNGDGTWTLTDVYRALMDTMPQDHAADSRIYFFDGQEGFLETDHLIGAANTVKLIDETDTGSSSESTATSTAINPVGRSSKALPPDYVTVNGDRSLATTALAGTTLTIAWRERLRTAGQIALEDDATEIQESGVTYTIRLYVDAVLKSTTSAIAAATYDLSTNVVDFGDAEVQIDAVKAGGASWSYGRYPLTLIEPVFTADDVQYWDTYNQFTVKGAWGLTKRVSTYSGPAIRVRDSSGGAEQDVGFDGNGRLDTTFTTTGTATVTTVYDQSGNGNHLVQATAAKQPTLNKTGAPNGGPCIDFTGGNKALRSTFNGSDSSPLPVNVPKPILIGAFDRVANSQHVFAFNHALSSNTTPFYRWGWYIQGSELETRPDGNQLSMGFLPRSRARVLTDLGASLNKGVRNWNQSARSRDYTNVFDGNINYPNNAGISLGEDAGGGNDFTGKWYEAAVVTGIVGGDYPDWITPELMRCYDGGTPAGAHRYWRIVQLTPNNWGDAYMSTSDIEMRGTAGGPDLTGSGTALSSGAYSGTSAANAFDGSLTSEWYSSKPSSTTYDAWIGYDFGSGNAVTINQFTWKPRTGGTYFYQAPVYGAVQYSDDGVTWYDDWYFQSVTPWVNNGVQTFTRA